jgi:hypothetical protein
MPKKLQTYFTHFRFNHFVQKHSYLIDWYRYDLNQHNEEIITPFNEEELGLFEAYTVANHVNFGNAKDYYAGNASEIPEPATENLVPRDSLAFPRRLILQRYPTLRLEDAVALHTEVILVDYMGADHHDYHLPFDVIGEIVADPP